MLCIKFVKSAESEESVWLIQRCLRFSVTNRKYSACIHSRKPCQNVFVFLFVWRFDKKKTKQQHKTLTFRLKSHGTEKRFLVCLVYKSVDGILRQPFLNQRTVVMVVNTRASIRNVYQSNIF